jgi:hypothetical protein
MLVKLGQSGIDEGVVDAYYIARHCAPYTTGSDYNCVQAVWLQERAVTRAQTVGRPRKKAGFTNYDQFVDNWESFAKGVRSQYRTVS